MALSVCLLTRNEEQNLPRAVHSMAAIADEVVVADTGSTDHTVQIANDLGAKVSHFQWNDDFAAGRNFALDQATDEWILWLNPDEELLPSAIDEVRRCMGREDAFGFFVLLQHLSQPDRPDYFTETADLRLMRRRPEVRYVGRTHPTLAPSFLEIASREGRQVCVSDIRLRHHAYLSEVTEAKLRWAVRLLELELRDRPGQLYYLIEYGRTLLRLQDPKGHAVLREAVEQILPHRDAPTAPNWQVQLLLEYVLTIAPEQSRSRLSREEARELARRWFPRSPPLLWVNAAHFFRQKDFRRAAELLEMLVHLGRTGTYDKSQSFHPGIIGDDALMNLGMCYGQLGELVKAESCFRLLRASPTLHRQAAQQLALLQDRRGSDSFSFFVSGGGMS